MSVSASSDVAYSIHFIWIESGRFSQNRARAQYIHDDIDTTLFFISRWTKAHPSTLLYLWFDERNVSEAAVCASRQKASQLCSNIRLEGLQSFFARAMIREDAFPADREIQSINKILDEPSLSDAMPVYFRVDVVRMVLAWIWARSKGDEHFVYVDVDVLPIEKAQLFSVFDSYMKSHGITFASTRENFFVAVSPFKAVSLDLIFSVFIEMPILYGNRVIKLYSKDWVKYKQSVVRLTQINYENITFYLKLLYARLSACKYQFRPDPESKAMEAYDPRMGVRPFVQMQMRQIDKDGYVENLSSHALLKGQAVDQGICGQFGLFAPSIEVQRYSGSSLKYDGDVNVEMLQSAAAEVKLVQREMS